jgi:hypothetical protein
MFRTHRNIGPYEVDKEAKPVAFKATLLPILGERCIEKYFYTHLPSSRFRQTVIADLDNNPLFFFYSAFVAFRLSQSTLCALDSVKYKGCVVAQTDNKQTVRGIPLVPLPGHCDVKSDLVRTIQMQCCCGVNYHQVSRSELGRALWCCGMRVV